MDYFDATKVAPAQGGGAHPCGKFSFQITNTYARGNRDNTAGMLSVEMTSDVGVITKNYNLFREQDKAKEIAEKEFSALCHATGIYRVSFPKNPDGTQAFDKAGFELRGGRGQMVIEPQKDKQGTETGYVEVKKVLDINGNEPGKPVQQQPVQQQPQASNPAPQQPAPMQQNPQGGGWSQPTAQAAQQNPQPSGGWQGGPQPQPAQPQQPAPAQGGQPAGWSQGNINPPAQSAPWSR